jgi:phage-related baseplate assembly protein
VEIGAKLQLRPGQRLATVTDAARTARRDRLAWIAYPKARQLGTGLNRDSLAATLAARGVQPVRQVSIDDTWSALRFRPA